MAKEAVTKALEDAGVPYDAIEAAVRLLRGCLQTIYNLQTDSCILSMFTVTFGMKGCHKPATDTNFVYNNIRNKEA